MAKHNKIEEEISILCAELNRLYSSYEDKVKSMFFVERSINSMEQAAASINQPLDRISHALFWFIKVSPFDEIAINNLIQGDTKKAVQILEKEDTYSSIMNRAIIALIEEDMDSFVHGITTVIHNDDYRNDFTKEVCGDNFTVSEEELAHIFIDILLKELPDEDWKTIFYDKGVSGDDDDYVCMSLAKVPSEILLKRTADVASIPREKGLDRYNAAVSLMELSQIELDNLSFLVDVDSLQYQNVADKVAREILNCSIDYYNKCSDTLYIATKQAVKLNQYAFDIAIGTTLKERAEDCLEQVKEKLQKMPPEQAFKLFGKINTLIAEFSQKPDLIIHSEKLLSDCAPLITEVKEILGKDNEAYLDLSTKVVKNALVNIIAEINASFENVNELMEVPKVRLNALSSSIDPIIAFESLRNALKKSWQVFVNMDLFDMESDFKTERYLENRKIILKHLSDFKISTYGIAPTLKMQTETEIFRACRTISSYKNYIKLFPNGKYKTNAETQISRLETEDNDYWNECNRNGDYARYISKYKYGIHAKEANAEIERLKRVKDDNYWAACCKTRDYKAYLSSYEHGRHAAEAKEILEKKSKAKNWLIFIVILLTILIGIAAIWGLEGFVCLTGIIALLGFSRFTGKGDVDGTERLIGLVIALLFGTLCYGLCSLL